MPHYKESFFIGLLLFITLLNIYDFYNDFLEYEHSVIHLTVEGLVILISIIGISYLVREIRSRLREIENLRTQLTLTRTDLDETSSKLRQVSRQYGEVIQEQLNVWNLTPSEKQVGLLLLKGLSFEEIANIRETKEKTVRQQATAIYRKSGLDGRYAFAAWFFEDFLG
ncbi:MAG: helix-turn-helix transcriptional regulator [Gammaproteobacteria bacterium]|nr:helix-turn-helix transcriptional regulator [Gammaproteobacteria bacterium]